MSPKIFSEDEIIRMIKDGTKIILVDNKLYNVTIYCQYHPGGTMSLDKKILRVVNNILIKTDCSRDYNFHSNNGKKMWKDLLIGITHKKNSLFNLWGFFT